MAAWGGGNGKFLFDGYKSINCAKNVLKKCCAIMKIYLTLLNCTLKNGSSGKFYVMGFVLFLSQLQSHTFAWRDYMCMNLSSTLDITLTGSQTYPKES